MGWGLALQAGASILGGALGASGAKSAAKTQANAAREGTAEQRRQFNMMRQDLKPYTEAGTEAMPDWLQMSLDPQFQYDRIMSDPANQYIMERGLTRATDAGIAGSKSLGSQGIEAGTNSLLNNYQSLLTNDLNRMAGPVEMGRGAAGMQVGARGALANNVTSLGLQGGNALAAGQMGAANAWGNTLNSLSGIAGDAWQTYQQDQQNRQNAIIPQQYNNGGMLA